MNLTTCQLCGSNRLTPIIDLGQHPLADYFLSKDDLATPEQKFPLRMVLCGECSHTMLDYSVPPEARYQAHAYSYTASNSKASIAHFDELAEAVIARAGLGAGDMVVDIGSNDGTLLSKFKERAGCDIVGVDPAPNIVAMALERGIPTLQTFFTAAVAADIVARGKKAKAILSTNTFNHITDLTDFMRGIESLLADDGVFVFEVPYFFDLVKQRAFDTIYLEHIFYFNVKPFKRFFAKYGLHIQGLERTPYMGGSIRVFVGREPSPRGLVESYIKAEEDAALHLPDTYEQFMQDVRGLKERLLADITAIKKQGARIIGIGAAAKGNTLLNYCGINATVLDFISDSSPLKIGKYTPGSRIPILPDEAITDEVTHALILPWNIADLLMKKLARPGLSFIVTHINTQ